VRAVLAKGLWLEGEQVTELGVIEQHQHSLLHLQLLQLERIGDVLLFMQPPAERIHQQWLDSS